jgi:hypothetical protein
MNVCVRVSVCAVLCVRACVLALTGFVCLRVRARVWMRTHRGARTLVCVCVCGRACVRVRACVRACVRVCVSVSVMSE